MQSILQMAHIISDSVTKICIATDYKAIEKRKQKSSKFWFYNKSNATT